MKFYVFLLLGIFITVSGYSQPCEEKYKDQLEPSSRLVKCGAYFTIERVNNRQYVTKRYFIENKTITHLATYKNRKLKVLHGLYEERWDDGTLVMSGMYDNNVKVGEWRENVNQVGFYNRGVRDGKWKTYSNDALIIRIINYSNGLYHGEQIRYDSLGEVILHELYEHGKLISTSLDSSEHIHQEMPRFPGCEHLELDLEELKKCGDGKLMEFIYSNIEYPPDAIEQDIVGQALIQFTIDEEGNVTKIKVLNGLTKSITEMLLGIMESMPAWKPGMQNYKKVEVVITIPIIFKLE